MTDLPVPPAEDSVTEAEVADVTDAPEELTDAERREAALEDTPEEAAARAPQVVETGNEVVDDVIRSLEGLDGVPVDEHVALFEQAHEQLRRTLSGAGDRPS